MFPKPKFSKTQFCSHVVGCSLLVFSEQCLLLLVRLKGSLGWARGLFFQSTPHACPHVPLLVNFCLISQAYPTLKENVGLSSPSVLRCNRNASASVQGCSMGCTLNPVPDDGEGHPDPFQLPALRQSRWPALGTSLWAIWAISESLTDAMQGWQEACLLLQVGWALPGGVLAGDGCIPPVGCCRVSSAVFHRVIYHTAVNHAGACVPMNRKVNLWAESHASGFGLRKTVHCFTLHLSLQTVLLDDFSQDLIFSWIFV